MRFASLQRSIKRKETSERYEESTYKQRKKERKKKKKEKRRKRKEEKKKKKKKARDAKGVVKMKRVEGNMLGKILLEGTEAEEGASTIFYFILFFCLLGLNVQVTMRPRANVKGKEAK